MIKFNKCKLNSNLLDQWVSTNVNVLLIGEKGVGKSHQIIDTFKRNNLKYAYFSGATLDPWIHLLGIPKAKKDENGKERMEFVLPENLDNDIEAIFCDEWNRTNKVVRNALLELQQFKSINGRKFPNLRMVWGAVNPPKDENEESADYDVDELDPAQLDRFHVVVELPNEPDLSYFKNKFGDFRGKMLVDWWKEQPKDALKILSPRRLDYVGECFNKGLDVKYLLPVSANVKELIKKLSLDEKEEFVNSLFKNPTDDEMKEFLKDDKNFLKYKNRLKGERYWKYWKFVSKEFLTEEIKTNINFQNFAIFNLLKKEALYKEIFQEIAKSNPTCNSIKIVKSLLHQNYVVEDVDINNFTGSQPNFVTINLESSNNPDNFSNCLNQWNGIALSSYYNPYITAYSSLTTSERRKAMSCAVGCLKTIKNKIHFVNFMISCLRSMQSSTINSEKNFLPLLGNACVFVSKDFSAEDKEKFINELKNNSGKLSNNRIQEFVQFLSNKTSSVLPESFLKKVKDIRAVFAISGGDSNILDLLEL